MHSSGGTYWYSCEDAAGNCKFMVRAQYPTLCNGCHNCLAPTCFNKVFEVEIFMPDRVQQVGMLRAIWPGCNFRCVSDGTTFFIFFFSFSFFFSYTFFLFRFLLLPFLRFLSVFFVRANFRIQSRNFLILFVHSDQLYARISAKRHR